MKLRKTVYFLLIVGFLFVIGCSDSQDGYDSFAQCLTEKEVVIYGTEGCPHCQNQKEMFGGSFQYLDYVDCDRNKAECARARVRGYPTWKINGESYPGVQPFSRLAALSGCEL